MSFFSKILDKLGLGKGKDQPAASAPTSAPVAGPPKPAATTSTVKPATPAGKPSAAPAPTSEKGVSTAPSAVERRQKDDVAVKDAPSAACRASGDVAGGCNENARAKGKGNWTQLEAVDLRPALPA